MDLIRFGCPVKKPKLPQSRNTPGDNVVAFGWGEDLVELAQQLDAEPLDLVVLGVEHVLPHRLPLCPQQRLDQVVGRSQLRKVVGCLKK